MRASGKESVADTPDAEWRPAHNHWLVALTVTLATFMEVLDTSIANVALPHIAGNLGASRDESTWILTSYLVSNAVVLPISAWLATRFDGKAETALMRRKRVRENRLLAWREAAAP